MLGLNAAYLNEATLLERKWSQVHALDGIKDKNTRLTMATLLENQCLLNERIDGGDATGSDDVAVFKRISIPMVRRIFAPLVANKIVAVQPLLGPTGLVYYLRFRYATAKGQQAGGDIKYPAPGWDNNSLQQQASGLPVADVWYSHMRVNLETATGSGGGALQGYSLAHTPILANSCQANSEDVANHGGTANMTPGYYYTMWGKIYLGATAVQNFRIEGTTLFLQDIGAPATKVTGLSSLDLANGNIGLMWNATPPGANSIVVVYEYNMECNTDLPKITMVVEQEEIVARTRKLKADWSWEAQQDLRSQHNIDAEQELTSVLAQEIALEIDREILLDLRTGAGTVATWNFATALGDTIKERYESLFVKLVEVSNLVMKKTLRGQANWIVTSPEICSIFETATAGFGPAPATEFESALGIQYVGTINNRWKLFKDPLFPTDQVLMGYKGDSILDTGYYYCPYVPLEMTPVVLDPDSLCPRKGVLTRYGKKMLREGGKYFAVIRIQNFTIS